MSKDTFRWEECSKEKQIRGASYKLFEEPLHFPLPNPIFYYKILTRVVESGTKWFKVVEFIPHDFFEHGPWQTLDGRWLIDVYGRIQSHNWCKRQKSWKLHIDTLLKGGTFMTDFFTKMNEEYAQKHFPGGSVFESAMKTVLWNLNLILMEA